MSVRLGLISLLFCSSCLCPTYTTEHGVRVFDQQTYTNLSSTQAELLIQYAFSKFGRSWIFRGWNLILFSGPQRSKSVDLEHSAIILGISGTCYADNDILHEMAHAIRFHDNIGLDYEHNDEEYWTEIEKISKDMIKVLCYERGN